MTDETPPCPDPSDHERVGHLERALESNRVIGAAVGIIMVRSLISYDEAFETLRRASSRLNRRVADLAEQTVVTGMVPSELTAAGNSRGNPSRGNLSRSEGGNVQTGRRRGPDVLRGAHE